MSDAAQRVGMSESALRSLNDIPPRMLIKAGSALIVPRGSAIQEDVNGRLADNGQLALAPEIVTKRTTVRAGKRDTVASVAQRYRVSASSVADWNDVKLGSAFKVGQQIVLHLPVRASAGKGGGGARKTAQAPARESKPARRGGTPSKVKRR